MLVKSHQINWLILTVGLVIVGFFVLENKTNQTPTNGPLKGKTAVVYRSASCGCCRGYIEYLKKNGLMIEEKIAGNDDSDLIEIKEQFSIPTDMRSCHTTRIDGYTVEGHVPVEAIQKLVAEKPAVRGIALPNMPVGSPGMPGTKSGTFNISSFTSAESSSPYISL